MDRGLLLLRVSMDTNEKRKRNKRAELADSHLLQTMMMDLSQGCVAYSGILSLGSFLPYSSVPDNQALIVVRSPASNARICSSLISPDSLL